MSLLLYAETFLKCRNINLQSGILQEIGLSNSYLHPGGALGETD
jgi:hypothetical protein